MASVTVLNGGGPVEEMVLDVIERSGLIGNRVFRGRTDWSVRHEPPVVYIKLCDSGGSRPIEGFAVVSDPPEKKDSDEVGKTLACMIAFSELNEQ